MHGAGSGGAGAGGGGYNGKKDPLEVRKKNAEKQFLTKSASQRRENYEPQWTPCRLDNI